MHWFKCILFLKIDNKNKRLRGPHNYRTRRGNTTHFFYGRGHFGRCQFKARLDKFWLHQDILYDYTADLTGIGDRSVHVTEDE